MTNCSICLDKYVLPVVLQCNHEFCFLCVKEMFNHSNAFPLNCPLCRREIKDECNSFKLDHTKFKEELQKYRGCNGIWLYQSRDNVSWWM